MGDFLKRVSNFLDYAVHALPLYLLLGLAIAGVYGSITSKGREARDVLLNKPYENIVSTTANKKSDDNTITTIEFIDTGQVRTVTGAGSTEKNKLWSVIYDKDTKLVYLYNPQLDTYTAYMKDKTTQYTWNVAEKELERVRCLHLY